MRISDWSSDVCSSDLFNMDMLSDREQLAAALGRPSIGVGDYYHVCSGEGYRGAETIEKSFGCYFPSEIHRVSERTIATFAMPKFGGESLALGGVTVSGNIRVCIAMHQVVPVGRLSCTVHIHTFHTAWFGKG